MTVSPGWAIELEGQELDLDDFESELSRPHSPWIERDGEKRLLRSATWSDLLTSKDVMYEGRRLIEQLNGAARLVHEDALEIKLGALRRFDGNGRPMPVTIEATVRITLGSMRMRGRGTVLPEPVTVNVPNFMQRAIAAAEKDKENNRAELLLHLARANNWFDLYKVLELTEAIKGGEHKLRDRVESKEWEIWKNVRQTANHYRHAPPKANALPPDPPPTPGEGLLRILPTVRRVVRGEL